MTSSLCRHCSSSAVADLFPFSFLSALLLSCVAFLMPEAQSKRKHSQCCPSAGHACVLISLLRAKNPIIHNSRYEAVLIDQVKDQGAGFCGRAFPISCAFPNKYDSHKTRVIWHLNREDSFTPFEWKQRLISETADSSV